MCIWRQCNKDPSAALGMTVLGERIGSQGWCAAFLFWLGLFTHRAFSSAQDDDTGERKGFHLGDMLRVLELAVLYYDTSSPL